MPPLSPFKCLSYGSIFILSWWLFFLRPESPPTIQEISVQKTKVPEPLFSIDRDEVKAALQGDTDLMKELIKKWSIESQILSSQGFQNIQFLTGKELYSVITQSPSLKLSNRIIPQTYAAAGIALSLAKKESILCIPEGLRSLAHIYPPSLTKEIPLNTSRIFSNEVFSLNPHTAIIAHYSLPRTIESFHRMGLQLVTLRPPNSLEDIFYSIEQMGEVTQEREKASLLSLFCKACCLHIENLFSTQFKGNRPLKVLYLQKLKGWMSPHPHSLWGEMLQRLDVHNVSSSYKDSRSWQIPLKAETIKQLNPDCILIAGNEGKTALTSVCADKTLKTLPAIAHDQVYFLDLKLQNEVSQYIILAYLDLMTQLSQAKTLY